jgi:hypothetical protein
VFSHTTFDLGTVGNTQQEFFVSGTAHAYAPNGAFGNNGKWHVVQTAHASYKTRIVVDRPLSNRNFNGTAVVEWLNVTGGVDASPDWLHLHDELIRDGYAWIGVSAQAASITALKNALVGDPVRYKSLSHPGDSFSYDIFSQAGLAVRDNASTVLPGLHLRRVLGAGESQSAFRLVTYVDAVHPVAHVYDGYLVHSRGGGGAALTQAPQPTVTPPSPTFIRNDLDVPVLQFETETDLITLGFLAARQPDTSRLRTWEVPGTAHFDDYGLQLGATDTGNLQAYEDWFSSMQHPTTQPNPAFTCPVPINSGPQTFVLRAAIAALEQWVVHGTQPPHSPRMETTGTPPHLVVDAAGIVRGGIRTPAVDAPVAVLSGLGQTGGSSSFCGIFGTTRPFSNAQLMARYHDHAGFEFAWGLATVNAANAGFLLPTDAVYLFLAGAQSNVLQ